MMTPEKRKELMAKVPENVRKMLEEQEAKKEAKKKEKFSQNYQNALEKKKKLQESQDKFTQSSQPIINNTPQPNTDQLEDKAIEVNDINPEVTIVSESQADINLTDEEKEQLKIDYQIWISIALQSSKYADDEGNIPINWQHLAKEYYQIQFTNNDPETQDLIDQAIALLDDEDKTLLNQIISFDNQDCTQKDILEVEEIKTAELDNNFNTPDTFNQSHSESLPIKSDNNQIKYKLIEDNEELKEAIALLTNEDILGIDTETTGLDPHLNKIRLIQIASYNHPTIIIDCFKCDARLIQPILINSSIKVFHNAKFDLKFFFALGLEVNQSIFDTMLAHQLVNLGKDNVKAKLKEIASEYLQMELNKDEQVSDWQSDKLSDSQLEYAVKDAEVLLPLREKLREEIIKWDLVRVAKLEFDCVVATAHKEYNGLLLDVAKWQNIVKEVESKVKELNKIIQPLLPSENTLFPVDINLNSTSQLLSALQKLGIPVKDTQTSTLEKYVLDYPEVLTPLLEYKKLSHFSKHFGDKLIKKINPITGRIHGQYLQLQSNEGYDSGGSASGRFSAKNPNLQQIPKDAKFRSCFVAIPEHKLVIADFSQFQIRIGAEIANDKTLIDAIKNNTDLHKLTASLVLSKDIEAVTKEERQLAKAINFGILFGLGARGLRQTLKTDYNIDISENEAREFINKFFANYKGLGRLANNIKSKIKRGEKILLTRTLSNRLRHFEKGSGYTTALNTPVQGSEADIVKLALGKLITALKPFNGKARLLASIHDEIILEAHEDIADQVAKTLSEVMVSSGKEFLKKVPIEADSSIGDSWADK